MAELIKFALPDFSNCGPAIGDIVPAYQDSIAFLKDLGEQDTNTGAWTYKWWDCLSDIPLTGIMYCLCGGCYVPPRTTEAALGGTCESYCLAGLATCCLSPCYAANLRKNIRKKYNIKGAPVEDLIMSWCLGPCSACQHAREVGTREANFTVPFTLVGADRASAAKPADTVKAPDAQAMDRKDMPAEAKEPPKDTPVQITAVLPDQDAPTPKA